MMTAKEARHDTDARISEIVARLRKLIEADVIGVNHMIGEAIASCRNNTVFCVAKFLKTNNFNSTEEQEIFIQTFHDYFKNLGYKVSSWDGFPGYTFQLDW